jgi:tetratricopeptide (TPR) repeat protein
MTQTNKHRRIAVAVSLGLAAGVMVFGPTGTAAQEASSRMRILAPPMEPQGGAKDDFGKKVAEEFRKEIDKLATHAPFEGRELKDALKKYGVKEEELAALECAKARQLAGLIQIPLVMCGRYTPGAGGMEVTASFISPETGDKFDVAPFAAANPQQAAQQIVGQFQEFVQGLSYTTYCHDYVQSQSWVQALDNCNKALAANPTGKSALYLKGQALWKMDSLQAALTVFEKLIEIDPVHQEALMMGGIIATSLEQRDIAQRYFKEYLQLNPGNANVRLTIAGEAAKAGDPETALGIVEEGLTGDSIDLALYQYAGQLALSAAMKRTEESGASSELSPEARALFDKSYAHLHRVMEAKGAEADATMVSNMAVVLNKLGRRDEMLELARRVQSQNLQVDSNFWLAHAESLKESGDVAGAVQALQTAVQRDPEAKVYSRMAVWLIQAGQVAQAVDPAKQAVQRGEMDGNELARMIAGIGWNEKGKTDQHEAAIAYYDIARQFATNDQTGGMINFFHGYAVLKQAIQVQEPSTVASARRSLPMFQRAKELLQAASAYTEQASTRSQLLGQVDQFIEIQELLIKRG